MSHNQSRSERSDSIQYRKTNRSGNPNQQGHYQGTIPVKGGGGASSATSNSSRSSKKYAGNAQGGQPRTRNPDIDLVTAVQASHNRGESHVPPVSSNSYTAGLKDTQTPNATRASDSAPSSSNVSTSVPLSNSSSITTDSKAPATPAKEDASRSFSLQFGSISPGIVHGVQIPARTSSAPPNLDEQTKSQVRTESSRAAPAIPNPTLSKQHLLKKNGGSIDRSVADEAQQFSKPKRETQPSAAPQGTQFQKPSVRSVPSMPMQMPFQQPQFPIQFGGPSPQMQSQALPGGSIPMQIPMHVPIGNPSMQQPIFISGLQPHPMQSQALMHQAQNFNLPAQMAHQIPPQLGSIGLSLGNQYSSQQAVKYGSSRKTVKITHPDTHEELKLEGPSGHRPHLSASPPQHVPSFPPNHPMSFYTNSYNYFPGVSMSANQVPATSQFPRFYNQVTVKPPHGSHLDKDHLSATGSVPHGEEPFLPKRDFHPSSLNSMLQSNPGNGTSVLSSDSVNIAKDVVNAHSFATASTSSAEEVRSGSVSLDSIEDDQIKGGHGQQDKVFNQPSVLCSLTSQSSDVEIEKTEPTPSGTHLIFETSKESPSTSTYGIVEVSDLMSSARISDEISENLDKKCVLERESAEQGETEMCKNCKFDGTNMETSMDTQEIGFRMNETCEQLSPSSLCDTITSKEEKKGESLDSPDDVLIARTLGDSKKLESVDVSETNVTGHDLPVLEYQASYSDTFPVINDNTEVAMKLQIEDRDKGGDIVLSPSSLKERVSSDSKGAKKVELRDRKLQKELFRKAEAVGTSSDLDLAYISLDEKKETVSSAENTEESSGNGTNQASAEVPLDNDMKSSLRKVEPYYWEDAASISPQLKSSIIKDLKEEDGDANDFISKKYSRDFLLKFEEECINLPEGFEVISDIANVLVTNRTHGKQDPYPSPGRNMDRPVGGPRQVVGDFRGEISHGTHVGGFRPGQAGNFGVTRNQRPQMHVGGILSGPLQNMPVQGGPQRNYSDSDRWNRGAGFQRGLMPSPQTPLPMNHKAEKRYEVGKVTDEEETKQRQLKSILNKLTPQNFDKLFQQVKEVNIDNVTTLDGVISQIFDKALMEPTFCEMYADFCFHLAADLPELVVNDQTITFKRLLLNKCQEEFEKREREEEEANKVEEEGESKVSPEEREEKRLRVRRRMLGNIRLIGELYKKRMLTERIMHGCISKLLGQHQNPDEENIEALCKLMSTIGEIIDHQKAKVHMDAYFQNLTQLSNNAKLSSRVRFMLKDTMDLRKNKWQQRRKVEGPKKIEEVHRDAAQERHTQSSRLTRAPSMGGSARRSSHLEFAPRAPSMLQSPGSHALHPQRTHGSQDARMDERHSYENRTIAVPLPQRRLGDDSITLGPQGGLVKGMISRVQPSADIRRIGPAINEFDSVSESTNYGPRYTHESTRERVASSVNREVPVASPEPETGFNKFSSEKELSDEQLRSKSLAAIKEFYSAKDENEVVLCIKELNSPGFYPSMISIWVTDSFELKDIQRNLLTNLLISIAQPPVGIINGDHLIKGFGSVLSLLEDAVNDAPRATEFLGHLFAKMITDNVVSFSDISRLVFEGGEEPGRLVTIGLAAEVLGFMLDFIESEKGDSVLKVILSSSSIQLETFKPSGSNKKTRLDKFI